MSKAAGLNSRRLDGSSAIAPMFFLTPLVTSAVPRLTWFFFFLVAIALIVPFLRREYTAERVLDHPWLGTGADSTPALKEPRAVAEQPPGFVFPRSTGQQAHDLFLQTWYELGVVGVTLIAFAGAAVALRISLLSLKAEPFAVAAFATFFAMAAFAWGIWQEWLMCAVGLLAIYSRAEASLVADDNPRALAKGAPLPILIENCWGERGGQSMKEAAYSVGFAVSFACVVAGCATSSIGEVHETEPGTYTIDVPRSYATVVASPDKEIIDAAVRKAGAYCHAKGLVLSVRSAVANRLAFQCVPGEPSR